MYISHNHNIRGNVKRKEIQNCFYIRADFGQSRVFIFIFFLLRKLCKVRVAGALICVATPIFFFSSADFFCYADNFTSFVISSFEIFFFCVFFL